jgi:hypothetical protein
MVGIDEHNPFIQGEVDSWNSDLTRDLIPGVRDGTIRWRNVTARRARPETGCGSGNKGCRSDPRLKHDHGQSVEDGACKALRPMTQLPTATYLARTELFDGSLQRLPPLREAAKVLDLSRDSLKWLSAAMIVRER